MKTSLFNIILDDGGDIMLFNSMRGLNSLCKVSENCREKVLGVLNGTVEDKEIEDILIDCGYLYLLAIGGFSKEKEVKK